MSRREVAEKIFPDSKGRVAVNRLARWIKSDPELRIILLRHGYRKYSHYFTPDVQCVLQSYLGF